MNGLPYDVLYLIAGTLPEQAVWRLGSVDRYHRRWLRESYLPRRIRATGRTDQHYPGGIMVFYRRYFICSGCGVFEPTQDPRDHAYDGRWECGRCEKRHSSAQLDMMDRYAYARTPTFHHESHHDADF